MSVLLVFVVVFQLTHVLYKKEAEGGEKCGGKMDQNVYCESIPFGDV
jgi:hypothetical protein